MAAKRYPWPEAEIQEWYAFGKTLQEIADILASDEWQPYWKKHLGREYRPNQKTLNSFCKRQGFALRKTGATGAKNGSWKGGRTLDKAGYVLILKPDHPAANACGYVREHRLIAEQLLGRLLKPTEVVHHKDDDPGNNSPDNLLVYETNALHLGETLNGKTPEWTDAGKERIAAGVEKAAANRRGKRRAASKPRQ